MVMGSVAMEVASWAMPTGVDGYRRTSTSVGRRRYPGSVSRVTVADLDIFPKLFLGLAFLGHATC